MAGLLVLGTLTAWGRRRVRVCAPFCRSGWSAVGQGCRLTEDRVLDTAGRVEQFRRRYGNNAKGA